MDLELCGKALEEDGFRLRGKTFLLTYPAHLDREDLTDFLRGVEGDGLLYLAAGQEIGKTGHQHTHVFVHRSKGRDVKNSRTWDVGAEHGEGVEVFHPNVRVPSTEIHKQRQLNYVFKQDEHVEEWGDKPSFGDDEWKTLIQKIRGKLSWNDVLLDPTLAHTVSLRMNWAKEIWNTRTPESLLRFLEWYPGPLTAEQEQWYMSLGAQTRRQILWVIDPKGGLGKSDFGIWLSEEWDHGPHADHDDRTLNWGVFLVDGGSVADQIHAYKGEGLVVIDIPRDTEPERFPYRLIENFKRGWASSTKYQSCVKKFKPAKVIVFSNTYPLAKLSKDRWVVYDYGQNDVGPHLNPSFPGVP